MSFILKDRVRESTTTTGLGAFALGGAIGGYRAFSAVMANSDTTWYSCVLPGGAWEVGVGTWVTGNTLQRTTLLDSSTGAFVSFGAGTKDIFIALPASKGNVQNNTFPSGTLMLFQQTSAPIYWTKQSTYNDRALRVVSGTASAGGSNSFSSSFTSSRLVSSTTITTTTMPSHAHGVTGGTIGGTGTSTAATSGGPTNVQGPTTITISSNGFDGAHNHTLDMAVQYVDVIIASKD